jgi:hypothetical protein
MISTPKAAEVIRELEADRKSKNDFRKKTDGVFCDDSGRLIGGFCEGFNSLSKLADAELDSDSRIRFGQKETHSVLSMTLLRSDYGTGLPSTKSRPTAVSAFQ